VVCTTVIADQEQRAASSKQQATSSIK